MAMSHLPLTSAFSVTMRLPFEAVFRRVPESTTSVRFVGVGGFNPRIWCLPTPKFSLTPTGSVKNSQKYIAGPSGFTTNWVSQRLNSHRSCGLSGLLLWIFGGHLYLRQISLLLLLLLNIIK